MILLRVKELTFRNSGRLHVVQRLQLPTTREGNGGMGVGKEEGKRGGVGWTMLVALCQCQCQRTAMSISSHSPFAIRNLVAQCALPTLNSYFESTFIN